MYLCLFDCLSYGFAFVIVCALFVWLWFVSFVFLFVVRLDVCVLFVCVDVCFDACPVLCSVLLIADSCVSRSVLVLA